MSNTHIGLKEFYEIHTKLGAGEIILDVRGPEEYQEGHIAGAKNIPVNMVAHQASELKPLNKIYIHCKRGGRAKTAFEALKAQGLNNLVCIADAGMDQWIESGYPVEKN